MGWSGEDGRWSPAGALKLYKPLICTYYILPHPTTIATPMPKATSMVLMSMPESRVISPRFPQIRGEGDVEVAGNGIPR